MMTGSSRMFPIAMLHREHSRPRVHFPQLRFLVLQQE